MALVSGSDGLRSALAHPNTRQFLKFAAVGLASLAVEYAFLVYLLQSLNMNYLMATTISFIISIVFNYILSMKYVFVHKEDMSRRREFIIFSVPVSYTHLDVYKRQHLWRCTFVSPVRENPRATRVGLRHLVTIPAFS